MRPVSIAALSLLSLLFLPIPATSGDLVEVGSGSVRYLGMIQVYQARLFAPAAATATEIQQATTDFCLELNYQVKLQPAQFIKAANTILQRQHSSTTLSSFQERIDRLHAAYKPVSDGDRYRLCYNDNKDITTLSLNNEQLAALQGADFATLYTGIWLAEHRPLDKELQQALLAAARKGA